MGVMEEIGGFHSLRDYLHVRAILVKHPTLSNVQNSTGAQYFYSRLTQEAGTQYLTLGHTGSKWQNKDLNPRGLLRSFTAMSSQV